MNSSLMATLGLALLHLAALLTSSNLAAQNLPASSSYLGEIRRNPNGQIVAVPLVPAATTDTAPELSAPETTPSLHPGETRPPPTSIRDKTASSPVLPHPATAVQSSPGAGSGPQVIRVGPHQAIRNISIAAGMAKDGDTIEIEAGDYLADVAVWRQDRLTIRGVGNNRPRLIAGGAHAEEKAIWVVRGGTITVENLEFSGTRVPDRNGAGIRFEKGHLIVRNCRFVDNENGILTSGGEAELDIENSEFGHNGTGDGNAHNLYVGPLRSLHVSGSYFHHARSGHLLKSRAAESYILYNRLTDEQEGHASYELEFPNGGTAYVIGNMIEQGPQTENSKIISYGAEGYPWPRNELYLVNNTIADDQPQGGSFLFVAPGVQALKSFNNLLVGRGSLDVSTKTSLINRAKAEFKHAVKYLLDIPDQRTVPISGEFKNNLNVVPEVFAQPAKFDYRLRADSKLPNKYHAPGMVGQFSLAPQREYQHPARTRALTAPPTLPGALQTLAKP